MDKKSAQRVSRLLKNKTPLPFVHPAVEHYVWTVDKAVLCSLSIGISPALFINILMGKVESNFAIDEKMSVFIDPDDLQKLHDDYNPLRFFEIVDEIPVNNAYTVNTYYPAMLLHKGDAVKIEGEGWCVISHVKNNALGLKLYSGGAFLLQAHRQSFCQAAVRNHEPSGGEVEKKTSVSRMNVFDDNPDMEFNRKIFEAIMDTLED